MNIEWSSFLVCQFCSVLDSPLFLEVFVAPSTTTSSSATTPPSSSNQNSHSLQNASNTAHYPSLAVSNTKNYVA